MFLVIIMKFKILISKAIKQYIIIANIYFISNNFKKSLVPRINEEKKGKVKNKERAEKIEREIERIEKESQKERKKDRE